MTLRTLIALAIASIGAIPGCLVAQDASERIAAVRARLGALEARTTHIGDIDAIENLQRAYGYYFDKMLWNHVVDLFADDGTMELGPSGVYVGKDSIRRYLRSLSGGREGPLEGVLYNHMQLQPIVTIAADGLTAKGRWRAWVLTGVSGSGSGGNWGEGPYENTYVKEGGVWKIESIHWFGNFLAPYEGGWRNADPAQLTALTASDVPPDRPPTLEHDPYPGTFIPPFHYLNPGRGGPAGSGQ